MRLRSTWGAAVLILSMTSAIACSKSSSATGAGGATTTTSGSTSSGATSSASTAGAGGGAPCDVQAADSSLAAVTTAVASAKDGQTVCVPPGTPSWNAPLVVTKAITLRGAGIGQTIVTDDCASGSLIQVTEQPSGSVRVEGFAFLVGAGPSSHPDFFINVDYAVNGKPVVIKGNKFALGSSANALGVGTNRGVITSNLFTGTVGGANCLNNSSTLRFRAASSNASWTTPPTYGTSDANGDLNLYYEDNTAIDVLEGVDVTDNGRLVFRHNAFTNSAIIHHGTDTSPVGARYSEIYNNTFTFDTTTKCPPNLPTNVNFLIYDRGGTMLIHDNVIPKVSSQAWGNKAEVTFTVESIRRNQGPYACWTQGYPAPHQVGWGYSTGGTQAGTSGVFQDLEPIYLWSNSGGGNYDAPAVADYSPNECLAGAPSAQTFVQPNREYYTKTPQGVMQIIPGMRFVRAIFSA